MTKEKGRKGEGKEFLLTRPLRDVTAYRLVDNKLNEFLLTRPLRDVTRVQCYIRMMLAISTHTPLAGRDRLPPLHRESL